MNSEYRAFVNGRKSKTTSINLNLGMITHLAYALGEAGRLADDLKRHYFYGTDIASGENKTARGRTSAVLTDDACELFHAVLGLVTESIEMFDRFFIDLGNKDASDLSRFDHNNWLEERGDLEFYAEMADHALNFEKLQVIKANIDKLMKRYPNGFSQDRAVHRDTAAEKQVLDEHLGGPNGTVSEAQGQ